MTEKPIDEFPLEELDRAPCHRRVAGSAEILVVKTVQGMRAYNGICPHLGGPLLEGDADARRIRCPWHHYEFDSATGRCLTPGGMLKAARGALPQAEPPSLRLSPLAVEEDDGKVRVFGGPRP